MTLGERIKACRQNAGMSQEKVAELVGVSHQAVAKWETDQTAPNTKNLFRLAEIFGTTVDLLLTSEKEERKINLKKQRWKRNLTAAFLVIAVYLVIYLLGRILWCDLSQSSFIGWLFTVRPSGDHSYLYGWLLSSNLFWYAMAVSAIPALFGKYKFSCVTLAAFVLGLMAGILFGPYPEGAAMGHGHYGWAIWGAIFLLSIPMGILAERFVKRKQSAAPPPPQATQ